MVYRIVKIYTTRFTGCRGFKERNNCCPPAMFANCLFTTCDRESLSCPANYRELDRTRNGCSGFNTKAYCCKESNLPNCFDMSCPRMSESKSCPSEYQVSKTTKGRAGGCESAFSERLTCCLMNGNGAHNTNPNSNSNTEVVSETKTVTLEDGTVQTVTRTQTHSKSSSGLFSSGESTMSAFFKILLFFPLLLSALL